MSNYNRRDDLIKEKGFCQCVWASPSAHHDCCLNDGCGKVIESTSEKLGRAWAEIERLREEIEVLRAYGDEACTAMADEILSGKRYNGDT
jgi:hypothetical protein